MAGGLSRFLHPNRDVHFDVEEEQFAPDGRNLSDTTHPDYDPSTDPELRLRITRTAAESIHESIREDDRRRLKRLNSSKLKPRKSIFSRPGRTSRGRSSTVSGGGGGASILLEEAPGAEERRAEMERKRAQANAAAEAEESARRQEKQDGKRGKKGREKKGKSRRIVWVNEEAVGGLTDPRGYERNKVRTSKYTLITFLPKNLMEQFRRIANIYFLLLIVLQVFPVFGAAAPQVAMLPLLAILCFTGLKDAIEDYRRQQLDDAVNNSAVTRLGDWKNVNMPQVSGPWWKFGSRGGGAGGVSKGVKKLREKEGAFDAGFLYQDTPDSTVGHGGREDPNASSYTLEAPSYPPTPGRLRSQTLESTPSFSGRSRTSSSTPRSDVVDYNNQTPGTAKWERTLWKKLEVGDIVLLKEDEQIPADLIVLSSSDPEGTCFVETKNLDGETNLKPRRSCKATMGIANEEDLEKSKFWLDSEPPHANLYAYNGVLKWRISEESQGREHPIQEGRARQVGGEGKEPVTINELLLRGCALRNTKWVIGLVVFTGADTKIMLNQGETPSKRSRIEVETNFNVWVNFALLVVLCAVCAVADGLYTGSSSRSSDYYEPGAEFSSVVALDAMITFGATLILFQNIVPISLVLTVELVKTIQAFFIYQDLDMYYEPLDHPCVPKTWNISDDLGQIEYVFSDKTGTLTQNVMEFQKCAVDGVAYGEGITEAMLGAAKREGRDTSAFDPSQNVGHLTLQKRKMISTLQSSFKNRFMQEDKVTLISPSLAADMTVRGDHQRRIVEFWRALAICHTVLADRSDNTNPNRIEYKAESPDEAALVSAARDLGFVFISRTNAEVEIEVMGRPERYVPLRILEFNSSRKRMTTIVRTPEGRILLICKGADSVIYQRLRQDHDPELIASTTRHLEDFANAGLRTLCISSRYLENDEFAQWAEIYDKACSSIEDREEEIERACELIERDLVILGATALEDKLQKGVPEAIEQLHKAGLKLWILTGDKLQTAIEIGFSCNLLSNDMELMIISADSSEGARAQIQAGLDKVQREQNGLEPLATSEEKGRKSGGFAVIIDGETLRYALEDPLKVAFLDLTTQCETVVCCRVSPSQKALTVRLVKEGRGAMTLAIGDGANDVAMIQEAHIGVGIAGLEGAQASMSADYAVGQFRFLTKLLIVHGRWCYIRVADMHSTFFYKNVVWTVTLFLYQIFCNFNSTYLYDYTLIMLFNLLFTSLPVAVLGIFDQDVSAATALAMPQLYRPGIAGTEYNRPIFFAFMLDGLYQSAIAMFIPYLVYASATTLSVTGHDFSVWEFGTTVAACAVTLANMYVGMHIRYWTWLVWVILIGSTFSFHVWIAIYSNFEVFQFEGELFYLYSTLNFWTSILFTLVAGAAPKFIYKYVQSAYYPRDSDIAREMEVLGTSKLGGGDIETAHKAEQFPLVTSSSPPRDRHMSDGLDTMSPGYRPPFQSLGSADSDDIRLVAPVPFSPSSIGDIPTIRIQGTTPRASVASRVTSGGECFDLEEYTRWDNDEDGEYASAPQTEYSARPSSSGGYSSPDLMTHPTSPSPRRVGSEQSTDSWETAGEHNREDSQGYAM